MDGGQPQYLDLAEWDRRQNDDPRRALRDAIELRDHARSDDERAIAAMVAARCLFELGRLREAEQFASEAVARSVDLTDDLRMAITMSSAVILAESGQIDAALAMLGELIATSEGVLRGRSHTQRAYVLQHAGRLNEALTDLDRAERLTAPSDDQRDAFRVQMNRGLVLLQQGRFEQAESDFLSADRLADRLGMQVGRAQCASNLGVLCGRARRIAASLSWFDEAELRFTDAGRPRRTFAGMLLDRAEVMLYSGLLSDALDAARRALELLVPTGNLVQIGDAQLLLARVEVAAKRYRSAHRTADVAAELFEKSGRASSLLLARMISVEAALAGRPTSAGIAATMQDAVELAAALDAAGWNQQADALRLGRIRAARENGLHHVVADDLAALRLGAFSGQRDEALIGWYAEAVARAQAGDTKSALAACGSGLDLLDDIVAEAPTLEQRSAAMRLGEDLSQLTIDFAVDLADADTVLAAAEGTRARALHDEVDHQRPHRPLTVIGAAQLRSELAGRLGDRTLVEWVVVGDTVWAVVFDASGSRLVQVADTKSVVWARDRVLVCLDMAATDPDGPSARALRAARLLDELLLAPLELHPDGGVVIVPVGLLHGIPWAGLPSFAGRPMTLAPNAQVWLEADRRAAVPARTVGFITGPAVGASGVELDAIRQRYPDAAVATGHGATSATVRSMFGGYDLVHVAAHGRFRSDRPLLSTLRLEDGESTLYDAIPDRLSARIVILSSCEGGAQGTADGSEVLGLSSVLLARGAASVLAPLTVVRELECADFVAEVHGELARGEPLACAVANVRGRWLSHDDLSQWAVASSFTCFGSGASTIAEPSPST